MDIFLIDVTSLFLFSVKWVIYVLAFMLLILGLDDLLIDLVYWVVRFYKSFFIFKRHKRADESILFDKSEQPLAIMIPAWNEVGVVGKMADFAATTLDYENYQIFVGVYPNDPDTQNDVDEVCQRFNNVHKVVCARPGPTSKADCLNNVINAIFQFEEDAGVSFCGFILHDAEDIISPLELRMFNFLLPRKDLIQVPVYPFIPHWYEFTGGHYIDEFAEQHAKDIIVREQLVGQVPSAGVGTCFSRKAVMSLLDEGDGQAFDVQSLTEDYDIGYRLKERGMEEIFARFYVRDKKYATLRESHFGTSKDYGGVICVREFFPRSFSHAVRQKSRWITGIVFQGMRNLGWSDSLVQNYFLWRDRRGALTNFVGLLVNISILIAITLYVVNQVFPQSWQFPSLLAGDPVFEAVLIANVVLLSNRVFQRFFFVCSFYGVVQGLISIPRTLWGNVINFCATWRALIGVLRAGDSRRVAWDKTQHELPGVQQSRQTPLGRYLVEQGDITQEQLENELQKKHKLKIGRALVMHHLITPQTLGKALAAQAEVPYEEIHPLALDEILVNDFPKRLALRYGVVPLRVEGKHMVLAAEKHISPVAIGAISRQIAQEVKTVMLPSGFVVLALRYWYGNKEFRETDPVLQCLQMNAHSMELITGIARYQVLLGDLLQEMGMISSKVFAQALFDFNPIKASIGRFMCERGFISQELLDEAVSMQRSYQQKAREVAVQISANPDCRDCL